jgi:hypothetical protein
MDWQDEYEDEFEPIEDDYNDDLGATKKEKQEPPKVMPVYKPP